jgi:hypothetical protein
MVEVVALWLVLSFLVLASLSLLIVGIVAVRLLSQEG